MLHEVEKFSFAEQKIPEEVENSVESLFKGYEQALIGAAISAESRAVHWDDANRNPKMHVGCSFLTIGKNFDFSQPSITTGANSKPVKGEMMDYPDRKCAEMNAWENVLGIDYEGKINAEGAEEIEQEDLGFVAAIVTIAEPMNTGEADTHDHDVVYPCKQCMTVYEYLMSKNIVSPKTIIYNARVKDGKVVAGKAIPLGKLIADLKIEQEQRYEKTIEELLSVKNQAFEKYRTDLAKVRPAIEYEIPSIPPSKFDRREKNIQRERREVMWQAMDECLRTILKAAKSAVEEGVPKERVAASLGLKEISLVMTLFGFTKGELEQISDEYSKFLLDIANPQQTEFPEV